MFGGILAWSSLRPVHRRSRREMKEAGRRPPPAGLPRLDRPPMDLDPAGLHQNDPLVDIHNQVSLEPRRQLDLFLKQGVRFLEDFTFGSLGEHGDRLGCQSAAAKGREPAERNEGSATAQVRK